jgi:tetratricopeptide (TPR) repeat protein
MSHDLSQLLRDWDYQPGQVAARRFSGDDGREKLQLRVDLGVLQMNAEGRPDGKRPLGQDSWFAVFQGRLERHRADNSGEPDGFELAGEDCAKLQQECIQYHHRYICYFQLEDFAGVQRDCERNLEVFQFVAEYAESEELAWSLLQFVPQLLMMRTRAKGSAALKRKRFDRAIVAIEEGLADLEAFYRDNGREDLLEQSGEINSLRQWLDDVRNKRPLTEREKLQRALDEAIQLEDYEKAAAVRDQLRKLQASES